MGNSTSQNHRDQTSIDDKMVQSIQNGFPGVEVKREVLTEFYVAVPSLPFYEKDSSGQLVPTKETAKCGDAFTASLNQPLFADLGMNTYLPLNDVTTGKLLLQTSKPTVKTPKTLKKKKTQ